MRCGPSSHALALAFALLVGGAATTGAQSSLSWTRCDEAVARARCAVLRVPEDRSKAGGRRIEIAVTVLPARDNSAADPMLVLLGGPGEAAARRVRALAGQHAAVNASRDVVLVDQRGTGRSSPLGCAHGSDDDLQSYQDFLPTPAVQTCVASLARTVDLSRYGTADFVEDLEALRGALGIRRWNLHGASYGSRVALEYMTRYPRSIRAAILIGVAPAAQLLPESFGRDADRALRMVAQDCRQEAECARAFPAFALEVDSVSRRLERGPVVVAIPHPITGERTPLRFSRAAFGEVVRASMYAPWGAAGLPLAIHEAYRGDFRSLAAAHTRRQRMIAREGWMGLYLAVTCPEDIASVDRAAALRNSRTTILGDFRARQHFAACAVWPVKRTADRPRTARITTPTLMIVGDRDPVTPPHWARVAQRDMDSVRLVIVPGGGHGFGGMSGVACLDRLQVAFVANPDPERLDTECAESMRPPRFIVSRR